MSALLQLFGVVAGAVLAWAAPLAAADPASALPGPPAPVAVAEATPPPKAEETTAVPAATAPVPVPAAVAAPPAAPTAAPAAPRQVEILRRPAFEDGRKARIYVLPVQGEINRATLFVVRRGLKEAIESNADLVLLEMDTPGGALDVTLDIMKMLEERFRGRTATYINTEAISAGAFISSATHDIFFSPSGIIGAAAPVMAGGQQIDESMRQKILSYLDARVRSLAGNDARRYRADVITAMADAEFELKVEGEVLKGKGRLLSLTAKQAGRLYGTPPEPLLSSGTAETREKLFDALYGAGGWEVREFPVTWSVNLAKFLTSSAVTSILLGLGALLLYLEFKSPGFGLIGTAGGVCLLIVFFGHYTAGLAGHEPIVLFVIGLLLVIVEIFVFPGTLIAGAAGTIAILVSLLWGMADIWPEQTPGVGDGITWDLTPGIFLTPLVNLSLGAVLAGFGAVVAFRYLPRTVLYNRLVLETDQRAVAVGESTGGALTSGRPDVGTAAVAVSDLRPGGQVQIDGRIYEALLEFGGEAGTGDRLRVSGHSDFALKVEKT